MKNQKLDYYVTSGISGILIGLLFLIFINFYIVDILKKTQNSQQSIQKVITDSYMITYNTEKLLTSFELKKASKIWEESIQTCGISISHILSNKDIMIPEVFLKTQQYTKKLTSDVKSHLKSEYLATKHQMDKPILIRMTEIKDVKEFATYYIFLRELTDKIEHLRQYQNIMVDNVKNIKELNYKQFQKQISFYHRLQLGVNIAIFILMFLFSLYIFNQIKKFTDKISTSKSVLENIINSIPLRVFWKRKDGVYLGANNLFLKDAKLSQKTELLGKNDFELPWKDTEAKQYVADDQEVIATKKPKLNITETQIVDETHKLILNTSKAPFFDGNGEVHGVVGIYEDITDKVELTEKLKKQELQMIQQSRLAQMGEMLSMIAHQWRQPLNVIVLQLATIETKLNSSKLDDQQKKEYVLEKSKKIVENVQFLSQTIDDFRDFFKPERKKEFTNGFEIVDEAQKIFKPSLDLQNIELVINNMCKTKVETYKNEVKQVILNIIKNAMDALMEKQIHNPTIWINSSCSVDDEMCIVKIKDNAGGIPQDIQEKIFDPYFSTKSAKNGTGLGLYMSKLIIEDHCKGEILFYNEDDGAVFEIRF